MSLYKRGANYWCEWQIRGQRIRESTGTPDRQAAQEYHDRRRAEIWREEKLGDVRVATWDEAALEWVDEHAMHKASFETDRVRLILLTDKLTGQPLTNITTESMLEIRKELLTTRAPATANRFMAIISAVLNYSHAKGKLAAVPKIPYLPEPKDRFRWITRSEAKAIIAELPEHLAAMTRFALATGLRRANITGLTWNNIDTDRNVAWIWPDEAKAGKPISVPLNADAIAVLQERFNQKDKKGTPCRDARYVFTYRKKPVERTTTKAWVEALDRAGIADGFTFHDLRHTWASWHVMGGTPLEVLRQLGGWADMTMVLRYAHLAPGYVAGYAENASLTISPTRPHDSTHSVDDVSEDYRGEATKMGWLNGLEPSTTGITILKPRKKAA
ncbi:MAG TPA: site-specific integrase [Gallionellaceae bacterium]|nr:site-specific integrase [Gallionellaceae bacterium]